MEADFSNIVMQSKNETYNNNKTSDEAIYDLTYAGFPAMLAIIAVMHFLFQFTFQSSALAWFAPVGNDTNDILKEMFWAVIIFSLFDFGKIKNRVNNYFVAKFAGIVAFGLTAVTLSYLSAFLFGTENIIFDAVPFIAGAALCQYVTYSLYLQPAFEMTICHLSKVAIVSIAVILSVSTNYHSGHSFIQNSTMQISQAHN